MIRAGYENELLTKYKKLKSRISNYKGYSAEVHMSQVLLNSENMILPGVYFNSREDVQMPFRFVFVRHRVRLSSGKGREIDILGAAGAEQWVCQSKWVKGKKMGKAVMVREDMEPLEIRMWLFAHDGLTKQAEAFARRHGILWSARKEFDELLVYLGLKPLPGL